MVVPEEPLISYTRSGGFAGRYEKIDIYKDGSMYLTPYFGARPQRVDLKQDVLDNLLYSLDNDFETLENIYWEPGADGYLHRIEYEGRKVDIDMFALPDNVTRVLDPLEQILSDLLGE